MIRRLNWIQVICVVACCWVITGFSQTTKAAAAPKVSGDWAGTWGPLMTGKDGEQHGRGRTQ